MNKGEAITQALKEGADEYSFSLGWNAAMASIPRISEQELVQFLHPIIRGDYAVGGELDAKNVARHILARFPQLVTRTEEPA